MPLIDCPECGGRVSDRAPTCPHCGFPIGHAAVSTEPAHATREVTTLTNDSVGTGTPEPAASPVPDDIEPWHPTLAGRKIPVAAVLFWGGMTVGVIISLTMPLAPDEEPGLWRRIPWAMIWIGVLWFAITEFGALIRKKRRGTRR
jgi:hypothetical protein